MLNLFRRNSAIPELIFLVLLFFYAEKSISAATCPSPDEIKERKVSQEIEWTVDENTSLEDMLTVTRLIAISIENQLEFISCKYKNDTKFVRLDGKPKLQNCSISVSSGAWLTNGKRKICNEKEPYQCLFAIDC